MWVKVGDWRNGIVEETGLLSVAEWRPFVLKESTCQECRHARHCRRVGGANLGTEL